MYKAIAANKRNTFLIMLFFVAIISVIGWIISFIYGNRNITYIVVIVAALYALIQYFAASALALSVSGAQQIEKADNPRLYRIIENLAITIGITMPKVYIISDPAPNAFATGRDPKHASVAVTTGLLELMDDRELESVLAHEMGHIQNYDIRVSMITFGLVSAIGLVTDLVLQMMFFGNNRRDGNGNPIVLVIGIVALVLAPILASIVQLAISRQREYLADATGALTTRDPEGLESALGKLITYGRPMQKQNSSTAHLYINNPLKPGFFAGLFSTHPPLQDRIERLKKSEREF